VTEARDRAELMSGLADLMQGYLDEETNTIFECPSKVTAAKMVVVILYCLLDFARSSSREYPKQ